MIVMYGLIHKILNSEVFFDDLLWHRVNAVYKDNIGEISNQLVEMGNADCIAPYNDVKSVVVWGAGTIASELITKSVFFKHVEIECFVDTNYKDKVGLFYGNKVVSPEILVDNDNLIVIAVVQGYKSVLDKCDMMGIDRKRIVKGLII